MKNPTLPLKMSRAAVAEKDAEIGHLNRIVLGLFNPMPDKHADGCLYHDPHIHPRGPCTCGYAKVAGEYLWALREAKKLAAGKFGAAEVDGSRRLKAPPDLVEAASQ